MTLLFALVASAIVSLVFGALAREGMGEQG
jgi:hypothetical protein